MIQGLIRLKYRVVIRIDNLNEAEEGNHPVLFELVKPAQNRWFHFFFGLDPNLNNLPELFKLIHLHLRFELVRLRPSSLTPCPVFEDLSQLLILVQHVSDEVREFILLKYVIVILVVLVELLLDNFFFHVDL